MSHPDDPLIINIKRKTPDQVRVDIARATSDSMHACTGCMVLTNRQTAFKLNSEHSWRSYPQCDDCAINQAKLICDSEGLLRKGVKL